MLKRIFAILLSVATLPLVAADTGAQTSTRQPILFVLYSRFYDHSQVHPLAERVFRVLRLLENERKQYPQANISALLEFSGTTSQILSERNSAIHEVDRIRDAARRGLVDIGYTGEDEPSYLYRPEADLLMADTVEKRWTAMEDAAERFLVDYKDPVTGRPVDGLTGGLKRTQEVFGDAAFISGLSTLISGDSAAIHTLAKLNRTAVLAGLQVTDPRRNIAGYPGSADALTEELSPDPGMAPEVYWENGRLRLAEMSGRDMRPFSTDETPKALAEAFAKLNRDKPRVIRLEIGTYARYLTKRSDGSVKWDPMEWLYYHPNGPKYPEALYGFVGQDEVERAYQNEEEVLKWLVTEFLPANPGSRIVSIHELQQMAENSAAKQLTRAEIREAAASILQSLESAAMRPPDFVKMGDRYATTAEAFRILATALAELHRAGSLPDSVKIGPMYGPLVIPADLGPQTGSVDVAQVIDAASEIAPKLNDEPWRPIPENAVPASVTVGTLQANAAQFLRLMAEVCLDASPRKIPIHSISMFSTATYNYPKNTHMMDQGNTWTVKPATLLRPPKPSGGGSPGF